MRALAIARFRRLTSIRAANPLILFCATPPLIAAFVQTSLGMSDSFSPDVLQRICATAAIFSWSVHAFMIGGVAHELGNAKLAIDTAVHASDLIDSVPVAPAERVTGEFTGVFASAMLIHICCLPLLGLVAALSPLPTRYFASLEGFILALTLLASASAGWLRVVLGPTRSLGMKSLRNSALFFVAILMAVIVTTKPVAFRDAFFQFFIAPSTQAWSRVLETVERPVALLAFLAAIYASYFAYFFLSSIGHRPQE